MYAQAGLLHCQIFLGNNVALIFIIYCLLSGVRHRSWALQRNPVRSPIGREYWWDFLYWQRSPLWHLLPHIEINHSHLWWSQPFSISYHVRYIFLFTENKIWLLRKKFHSNFSCRFLDTRQLFFRIWILIAPLCWIWETFSKKF